MGLFTISEELPQLAKISTDNNPSVHQAINLVALSIAWQFFHLRQFILCEYLEEYEFIILWSQMILLPSNI